MNKIYMGAIIGRFAFVNTPPSYDERLSYLEYIIENRVIPSSILSENVYTYKIPVRYYHINNGPVILICHGNAEDIGQYDVRQLANIFRTNICVFDYAGYGLHSERYSSEQNCHDDIMLVYKYLISTKGYKANQIVILGRSLGSGPACQLAYNMCNKHLPPLGLILISPIMSCAKVVTNIWIPGDLFTNYKLAPYITCPTLVIHGNADKIVPYECGKSLSLLFPNLYKLETLPNIGHNDIFNIDCFKNIKSFLENIIRL